MKRCTELILEGGFQPLRRTLLLEQLELNEKEGIALLKACAHQNRLVQVSEDLYYTPEQIDQAVALLRKHFKNQPVSRLSISRNCSTFPVNMRWNCWNILILNT